MTDFLTSADESRWRQTLPTTRSVFGSFQYAHISEGWHGYSARLFVHQAGPARVAYPVFLRPIALPSVLVMEGGAYDTLSPEYTGPLLVSGTEPDGERFRAAWEDTCSALGVVAEFAHLHPWTARSECLDSVAIKPDREIVYVDLTIPLERLYEEHFTYACRKNLRRAQTEDVEVYIATKTADIEAFRRIYTATMARNNALRKYGFSLEYFMAFFETMRDNACFMMARYMGKTIAGTLYLHDDSDMYSYLGGAYQEYQNVRPSNAVVFEAIRWAKAHGKRRLILGGGYKPDDGIFRFKASFSPLRARFSVYRKIHSPLAYQRLTDVWSAKTGADPSAAEYFPAYRAPEPSRP